MGDSSGEHELSNSRLLRDAGTGDDIFVTTCWTVVLNAADLSSPEAEQAMEEVCKTYWFPLYAYIRRRGHSPEDAEDLTQEFFHRLLDKHWIKDADRTKGRLRAFLITALKRFMAKEWRKASAQKRGGGRFPISIDSGVAEGRYASTDITPSAEAEKVFDHQWAITLLELTLQRLKDEYADSEKPALFAALKDGLFLDYHAVDYPAIADRLGVSEGALRVTVHRMRKRFRELYREEVAQTLPDGADLNGELRHLAESLAQN